MLTRLLDWLNTLTPREAALLCLLITTGLCRPVPRLPGSLAMPEEEIRITEAEYRRVHPDFRGVWSTERYDIPAGKPCTTNIWASARSCATAPLYIEGMALTIVPDWSH